MVPSRHWSQEHEQQGNTKALPLALPDKHML